MIITHEPSDNRAWSGIRGDGCMTVYGIVGLKWLVMVSGYNAQDSSRQHKGDQQYQYDNQTDIGTAKQTYTQHEILTTTDYCVSVMQHENISILDDHKLNIYWAKLLKFIRPQY